MSADTSPRLMPGTGAAARHGYESRPGRLAVVVSDLADLRGPVSGKVTLPLRLWWRPSGRVWDLDDPEILQAMYEAVLTEAVSEDELRTWLNGERLISVWAELFVPGGVRRSWEERHPVLRAGAAA